MIIEWIIVDVESKGKKKKDSFFVLIEVSNIDFADRNTVTAPDV